MIKSVYPVVLTANDGVEAIKLLKEYPSIDLILLDIKMPKMDGYETISEIRKINPKIPVIAQTAHAFLEEKVKIEKAGFDDLLTKPIERKKLLN